MGEERGLFVIKIIVVLGNRFRHPDYGVVLWWRQRGEWFQEVEVVGGWRVKYR